MTASRCFLCVALLALCGRAFLAAEPPSEISVDRLKDHIDFLASDLLEGRDSGEPGLEVAAAYLAREFAARGMKPAGDGGRSYFQNFTVPFGADFGSLSLIHI